MINQPNPQPISASLKPPRKRNIFFWLRIGCFLFLLMACGLWAAVSWWQNYQQEQHYQAGHEAYLNADCPTAIENFDKALAIDSLQIASLERALCEYYMKPVASHTQGRWVEALLGYSEFVATRQSEPLEDGARRQVAALFAEAGAAALAEDTVCKEVDRLMAQELIPEPAANLPPLYLACGQLFEGVPDYPVALYFYDRFRTEYPDHDLAEAVQEAYVRTVIAETDAVGAGSLPQPDVVGSTGSGPSVVLIQNDSPEEMSIYFSGPVVRIEELGSCESCRMFSGSEPAVCSEQGPVGKYTLPPGTYDVVVASTSSAGVIPFRGNWTLNSGDEYASCFFLVENAP